MLNISNNQLNKKVNLDRYKTNETLKRSRNHKYFDRFLIAFSVIGIIVLFLPWTQNVSGQGYVTTLTPDQRPQTIQSPIPGRIEKWYVKEGDFVQKGDTILYISEIKNEYQDPDLVGRTEAQKDAKQSSAGSYQLKIEALEDQMVALSNERGLKLEQAENKIEQARLKIRSDSIDLEAAKVNLTIAERQYQRIVKLQEEGLKSVREVEEKELKQQEELAKKISQQNKLLTSKNELVNARVELGRIRAEYADKIAKTRSDLATASSSRFEAEAAVAKLENQSANYRIRSSLYYITAPQSGFINKALIAGIGETFKEGERLVGIMPSQYDLAVETFVDPIDLPLVHLGEEARIQFDGWPAIFFSGWPNASYGTFGGRVVVVENFISDNGKFRVLIAPDPEQGQWPENVRIGTGAYTIALLEDVPIWYELWRRLNGFPNNYYEPGTEEGKEKKADKR